MKLEYYRTPCGRHSTDISADDFPQMESIEQCPNTTSHQPNFRRAHHHSFTSRKHPNSFFLPSFSKSSSLLFTLLTIACLLITITSASSSSSSSSSRPEDQSTTITQQQHQQHLLRQFRHRLHSQQHRRHHYYSALLHSSRKANNSPTTTPTTPTTSTSTSSTSALYNHLKVPSSVWSRHRSHHYYHHHRYYHYDHDELQLKNKSRNGGNDEETELIQSAPAATFRWSARSASARLLREHSSPPTTSAPPAIKVIYQSNWITSDDQLPVCEPKQVCNKVDIYSTPWIEKQCRCPVTGSGSSYRPCSESLNANDGHTVVEKTKLYKTCEPVRTLPTCKDFYNITWTITTTSAKKNHLGNSLYNSLKSNAQEGSSSSSSSSTSSDNITRQEMRCRCPAGSVAYIKSHNVHKEGDGTLAYQYHFVCSPETKLRCKRKEPCRLFTTRRRSKVEEVNTNNLCQCPGGYTCPTNHRHPSVLAGSGTSGSLSSASHNFSDNLRTFSAFCYLDSDKLSDDTESRDHPHHQKTMTTETTSDEVTEGKLRSQHHHPADYKDSMENQQQQQYHFSLLNR